jgi:hypothetical protein
MKVHLRKIFVDSAPMQDCLSYQVRVEIVVVAVFI